MATSYSSRGYSDSALARLSRMQARGREANFLKSFRFKVLVLLLLHAPLALLVRDVDAAGQLHSLGMLALGGFWLINSRTAHRVPYVAAYIVGAELLWRMTGANVLHEYGKYAAALLLLLALIRQGKLNKANKAILFYFLLLLPSMALTFPTEGWATLERKLVSFYMSGPFLLTVAVMYFSTVRFSLDETRRLLIAFLLPVFATGFLAFDSTLSVEMLQGYDRAAAGGFGQNQVSSILGLGMLAAALFAVTERRFKWFRLLIVGVGLFLTFQSLLTMSRGGFLTGLGAVLVAAYYLIRSKRLFASVAFGGVALMLIGQFLIVPLANDLTGGYMEKRYEDFTEERDLSGRDVIWTDEWHLFVENPVFGVGPGGGEMGRGLRWGVAKASHTEITRLPAEHGIFGVAALVLLFVLVVYRTLSLRNAPVMQRALSVSFMAWAVAFSLHAAMRLAAPGFLFGLAFASFLVDDTSLIGKRRRRHTRRGVGSGGAPSRFQE